MKRVGNKGPQSTYEKLSAEGYKAKQELMQRKKVSVSEKGITYILNTNDKESVVYSVDGCIIKEGRNCDKLVLIRPANDANSPEEWIEIFVELKGTDISTAIEQLRETLKNQLFKDESNIDIRARIIGKSFPSHKSNSIMEKAKISFKKEFSCELRGLKSKQVENLIKK